MLLAGGRARGQDFPRPAAGQPPLEGIWRGGAATDGEPLELNFSIIALAGGRYFSVLDVPAQQLAHVTVEVEQAGDSVRLRVPDIRAQLLARLAPDGQQLRGTWSRPGRTSPVALTRSPMPGATSPAAPAARPAQDYQQEEVRVSNPQARLQLAGTLTVPFGTGPWPAVVLVSDAGEQNRDGQAPGDPAGFRLLEALADHLTRHGFAVLRLDDRGVGESEGRDSQATPMQRAGDAAAALNYLRTRLEVDAQHLGLIGHGEGANVALLVAAQPLPPAFVVGLGAYGLGGFQTRLNQFAASLEGRKLPPARRDSLLQRESALLDLIRSATSLSQTQSLLISQLRQGDAALTPAAAQQLAARLLTPWHRAYLNFDPLESLPLVQCPVLLLTGQDDKLAPAAAHMQELERELRADGNRFVTAQRVPHVNHQLEPPPAQWKLIDGEHQPVLSAAVATLLEAWLTQQVAGAKKK